MPKSRFARRNGGDTRQRQPRGGQGLRIHRAILAGLVALALGACSPGTVIGRQALDDNTPVPAVLDLLLTQYKAASATPTTRAVQTLR